MTNSEIAALEPDQLLDDHSGRKWRVLHEPRTEAGTVWAMIRSGDRVLRLTCHNADRLRIRSPG